jgi:peroxin-3
MFSAVGNYIYDRRRGLFKTAGVVGTLYIAGKYVLQRLEEVKEAVLTERNAKEKCVLDLFPICSN